MRMRITGGLLEVAEIGGPVAPPEVEPPEVEPPEVEPPAGKTPYFRVGSTNCRPGETAVVPVFAGCAFPMSGWHIGGGMGGWDTRLPDILLGPYIMDYLKGRRAFEKYQYVGETEGGGAIPEAFWESAVGFFSSTGLIAPIPIPPSTLLFNLFIDVPAGASGELELTCLDKHYYTRDNPMKRDYTFTGGSQGYSNVDTFGGKITVVQ